MTGTFGVWCIIVFAVVVMCGVVVCTITDDSGFY